ncbi:hypothetical protein AV521_03400 [Streptomyces sp. IMTB 2501]|nr:hypothetical protein AV521_03400 [Streptomyces sp. IMTB 2501]
MFGGLLALVAFRVIRYEHRRFITLGLAWAVSALFLAVTVGWAAVSDAFGGPRSSPSRPCGWW